MLINYQEKLDNFIIQTKDNKRFTYDYIVDATGIVNKLDEIDSNLLKNMRKKGMVNPHSFGGITVDFETSNLIDKNGVILNDLYAIGNLTAGTYFFTSVLELNIKHAHKIANLVIDRVHQLVN